MPGLGAGCKKHVTSSTSVQRLLREEKEVCRLPTIPTLWELRPLPEVGLQKPPRGRPSCSSERGQHSWAASRGSPSPFPIFCFTGLQRQKRKQAGSSSPPPREAHLAAQPDSYPVPPCSLAPGTNLPLGRHLSVTVCGGGTGCCPPPRPPTSSLGAGGLPTPLLPAQLPPSARQDRVRPCPCCHPNLTPWAGAAHFAPSRLAAAQPCCLPCWLLVGLVPQGSL